jgi:hypothetical protein
MRPAPRGARARGPAAGAVAPVLWGLDCPDSVRVRCIWTEGWGWRAAATRMHRRKVRRVLMGSITDPSYGRPQVRQMGTGHELATQIDPGPGAVAPPHWPTMCASLTHLSLTSLSSVITCSMAYVDTTTAGQLATTTAYRAATTMYEVRQVHIWVGEQHACRCRKLPALSISWKEQAWMARSRER